MGEPITARAVLSRPRRLRLRIEEQRERIARLEARAQHCTSNWSGVPGRSVSDARYDAVAKLVSERAKLDALEEARALACMEAMDWIGRLESDRLRRTAQLRSMDELSWRQIGRRMGVSPRTAMRWYDQAITILSQR